MKSNYIAAAAALTIAASCAHAQETVPATPELNRSSATTLFPSLAPVVTWRIQGPAFAKHFEGTGAPVHGRSGVIVNDGKNVVEGQDARGYIGYGNSNVSIEDVTGGRPQDAETLCSGVASALRAKFNAQNSASYSADSIKSSCLATRSKPHELERRHYNQTNAELGLEREARYAGSVERLYGGLVIDSYYKLSAYAGIAEQATIYRGDRLTIDAGATALLWYRSVADNNGDLHRRLVPGILPMLTITDKSGVALNLSFVPAIRYQHTQYTVNTLIAQVTWAL